MINLNILVLDTSSRLCQVGLCVNGQLIERRESSLSHSKIILQLLDELISDAGIGFEALDAITLTRGPGSFTGLRIGISVAQGLSFAHGIPLLPVSTLQALACEFYLNGCNQSEQLVLATLDARMDQIYAAWYVCGPQKISLIGEEQVVSPGDIEQLGVPVKDKDQWQLSRASKCTTLNKMAGEMACSLVGSGLFFKEKFPTGWLSRFTTYPEAAVTIGALATFAETILATGGVEQCVAANQLMPDYLRNQVTG